MTDDYLLGIDAGTSVVKAVLIDRGGREIAASQKRTRLLMPHIGWSEASMDETWDATLTTIRDVLARANVTGDAVAAIGITGNMIGCWMIDADGEPVRDGIYWNDGRTQPLIEQLSVQQPGFMNQIFNLSGSVMQQGCTLPLARWLADNEPDNIARAQYILNCKDWIRYKLTGRIAAEASEASMLPGDNRARGYSDRAFELLGIAHLREKFAPLIPSDSVAGEILPSIAAETGLHAGTPVAAGAGDVSAVTLGVGAVEPGMACSILGTTSINGLVVDRPIFEPQDIGLLFYVPHGRWLRALANIAGTTNLDWFIDQFCAAEKADCATPADLFARLERLMESSEPGARGVIYHPYLSTAGIIAPVYEPAARAQFSGLSIEHTRADMLRAIYEGVAFAIRDCYAAVDAPLSEIYLSGGGARSPLWSQIIADCTGKRVVVPAGSEFGAKGAALLAGVAIGWYASPRQAASSTVTINRVHEPDTSLHSLYDARYATYRDIRELMRPAWQQAAQAP